MRTASAVMLLMALALPSMPASARFQSALVINHDHLVPLVAYGPGSYTLTREQAGTRYVALLFRPRAEILDGSWIVPKPEPVR